MAARDHKDLLSRTQDLSLSFVQHFIEHEEPWCIKDSLGRYLLASHSFCDLYRVSFNDIHGLRDDELVGLNQLFVLPDSYSALAMEKDCIVHSLETNYFNSSGKLSIKLFISKPFYYLNDRGVIVYIRRPGELSISEVVFSRLGIRDKRSKPNAFALSRPLEYFSQVNPKGCLTEEQWEIGWLILAGISYRDLAEFKAVNIKTITKLVNVIFEKLHVNCFNNFVFIGGVHGWINLIPSKFLSHPTSTLLKITV